MGRHTSDRFGHPTAVRNIATVTLVGHQDQEIRGGYTLRVLGHESAERSKSRSRILQGPVANWRSIIVDIKGAGSAIRSIVTCNHQTSRSTSAADIINKF